MKLLRFALWNAGVRLCDTPVSAPLMWIARLWERLPGDRESSVYPCMLHPDWLIRGLDISEAWWDRFGWRKVPNGR